MVSRQTGCRACSERLGALGDKARNRLETWVETLAEERSPVQRLRRIATYLAEALQVERCSVLAPTGDGVLRVLASSDASGEGDTLVALERYPELAHVLDARQPLLVEDARTSDLMAPVRRIVAEVGVRSVAAAPVRLDDTTAVLRLRSDSRPLTADDLALLAAASHLAEHLLSDGGGAAGEEHAWDELARTMPVAILDVDAQGKVRKNTGALLRDLPTLEGTPLQELLPTIAGTPCAEVLADVLDGRTPPRGARATMHPGAGETLPVDVWGVRVDTIVPCTRWVLRQADEPDRESPPALEASLRATLERQQQELEELRRRLRHADAERARFISSSAHELKTPLTVVQSYLEILLSDLCHGLNDEQLSFLRIAYESVLRLRRLVLDLVDLAALAGGKVLLSIDRVDVADVLASTSREMRPLAARSGITLEHAWPDGLPAVRADADRLRQVVRNLVDNAIKYTPSGGHVRLEASSRSDSVVVTVADDGLGVPADRLPHLFDEFVQLQGPRNSDDPGSGLGLAISQRIVRALGGRVEVDSVEGEGTRFDVVLPRWPEDEADGR